MWVVIFYNEDGEVVDEAVGPFDGHASADAYGAEQMAESEYSGYLVLWVRNPSL